MRDIRPDIANLVCAVPKSAIVRQPPLSEDGRLKTLLSAQRETAPLSFGAVQLPSPRVSGTADIVRLMSRDELYRVAYVPFVIAEVVWDYADSLCNLAAIARIQQTKKLCRAIRELRRDYDRARAPFIDDHHRAIETNQMISFQEALDDFFGRLLQSVKLKLHLKYGQLAPDSEILVSTCYMAVICFRALDKYVQWADTLIETRCGNTNHSIMPDHIRRLGILLPEFAGDCQIDINTNEMGLWRDILYNRIHSIQLGFDDPQELQQPINITTA